MLVVCGVWSQIVLGYFMSQGLLFSSMRGEFCRLTDTIKREFVGV